MRCKFCNSRDTTPIDYKNVEFDFQCNECGKQLYGRDIKTINKQPWHQQWKARAESSTDDIPVFSEQNLMESFSGCLTAGKILGGALLLALAGSIIRLIWNIAN